MLADKRLWRTASGDLVADGHLDAVHLAYAPEDVIAPADEASATKALKPAPNKSVRAPSNKSKSAKD